MPFPFLSFPFLSVPFLANPSKIPRPDPIHPLIVRINKPSKDQSFDQVDEAMEEKETSQTNPKSVMSRVIMDISSMNTVNNKPMLKNPKATLFCVLVVIKNGEEERRKSWPHKKSPIHGYRGDRVKTLIRRRRLAITPFRHRKIQGVSPGRCRTPVLSSSSQHVLPGQSSRHLGRRW